MRIVYTCSAFFYFPHQGGRVTEEDQEGKPRQLAAGSPPLIFQGARSEYLWVVLVGRLVMQKHHPVTRRLVTCGEIGENGLVGAELLFGAPGQRAYAPFTVVNPHHESTVVTRYTYAGFCKRLPSTEILELVRSAYLALHASFEAICEHGDRRRSGIRPAERYRGAMPPDLEDEIPTSPDGLKSVG